MEKMIKNVIVFGSSYMAEEYLKVLKELGAKVTVISRNLENARKTADKYGFESMGNSIESLSNFDPEKIDLVIVASAIPSLKNITINCAKKGFKNILVEKPGSVDLKEMKEIKKQINDKVIIRYALNRRFYSSVIKLKSILQNENITGCFFDFTERQKDVLDNQKETKKVVARWGIANSIHVIDLAFYLIGIPKNIFTKIDGYWEKHPSGNIFSGCGETSKCIFSYFSSWDGAGRWNVEISTIKGRYKLSPLETLQFCEKNQFNWSEISLSDSDDDNFKPGILKMTKAALENLKGLKELPNINEQTKMFEIINKICGYDD
ncbi:Gfo/Idh/MocA family oxidoreductase [Candidatus Woesearchaeota archaeon]|nr:Gfo/Idh/MocA family oxidoreductase [Candidatus Woesearchaeota archaeon]